MTAASNPNYHVIKAVLANGKDLYYEQVNKELTRRREDGESLFPKSIVGYFDFLWSDMSPEYGPNWTRINGNEVGIRSPLLEAVHARLHENV
jgi:hypothetical protein